MLPLLETSQQKCEAPYTRSPTETARKQLHHNGKEVMQHQDGECPFVVASRGWTRVCLVKNPLRKLLPKDHGIGNCHVFVTLEGVFNNNEGGRSYYFMESAMLQHHLQLCRMEKPITCFREGFLSFLVATIRKGEASVFSWLQSSTHCQMPLNPNPVARIKCWQSANHRYIHICTCHRLRTILTFLQNVSYHIHITSLWPDFHIGRSRGWQQSYTWQGCKAKWLQFEC